MNSYLDKNVLFFYIFVSAFCAWNHNSKQTKYILNKIDFKSKLKLDLFNVFDSNNSLWSNSREGKMIDYKVFMKCKTSNKMQSIPIYSIEFK